MSASTQPKILGVRTLTGAKYIVGQQCSTLPGKGSFIREIAYHPSHHTSPDEEGRRRSYPPCLTVLLADGGWVEIPYHRVEWIRREEQAEPKKGAASPSESAG